MTVGSKMKKTLASLKGAESTLRVYSIQTTDKRAKAVYRESLKATDEIIQELQKRQKYIEGQEPQYKSD